MPGNLLVTACNEPYGDALMTMVASVQRTSFDVVDRIVFWDLGLAESRRAELARLEKVEIRDFPREAYRIYPGYMSGGGHGYKLWVMDAISREAAGDAVLWLDAGAALMRSAAPIFDTIRRVGVFAVEHDLDDTKDLTQGQWTTPRSLELMEATAEERAALQMWGGIFGWAAGGPYQAVVDQAYAWSLDAEILLGPPATHRFDQSILSTLCTRHGVPFQPQAVYGEWRRPDLHPEQVVFAHRRGYDDRSGLRFRREPPPVVVLAREEPQLLGAFRHLFHRYWGDDQRLVVEPAGLDDERWSDALIALLDGLPDDLVIWCRDDFWLTRPADRDAVDTLVGYMRAHPDIARCDLTSDVVHVGAVRELESLGRLDLVECTPDAPYQLGLQCAIWRRELLRRYVAPGETLVQTEHAGTERMAADGARVIGTRQWPVRYLIASHDGRLALDGGPQDPPSPLAPEDVAELDALGLLSGQASATTR